METHPAGSGRWDDRLEQHKATKLPSQQQRREEALTRQKKQRAARVAQSRSQQEVQVLEDLSLDDTDMAASSQVQADSSATAEMTLAPPASGSLSRYANVLMYAEVLDLSEGLPADLSSAWLAVAPPKGKRVLAVSHALQKWGKKTDEVRLTLCSRVSGKPFGLSSKVRPSKTPVTPDGANSATALPTAFGSKGAQQPSPSHGAPSVKTFNQQLRNTSFPAPPGVPPGCELDCIYDVTARGAVLWVLDVRFWGGSDYRDCDTDFRLYWRDAKLSELPPPALPPTFPPPTSHTLAGPYLHPFILRPVPYISSPLSTQRMLDILPLGAGLPETRLMLTFRSQRAENDMDVDCAAPNAVTEEVVVPAQQSDGLLLYMREASYGEGSSPLVCWVPPPDSLLDGAEEVANAEESPWGTLERLVHAQGHSGIPSDEALAHPYLAHGALCKAAQTDNQGG